MNKKLLNIFILISFIYPQDDISFNIDKNKSYLLWRAEKLTGNHWGYIAIKTGEVTFNSQGQLKTGGIVVDMSTITIEDNTWKEKLKEHLESDDFFSVNNFPESRFKINKLTPNHSGLEVDGMLTIKGVTHPNKFIARVKASNSGYSATGKVVIDRTLYGIKYRSGKYFSDLGNRLIYDNFTIEFNLVTKR